MVEGGCWSHAGSRKDRHDAGSDAGGGEAPFPRGSEDFFHGRPGALSSSPSRSSSRAATQLPRRRRFARKASPDPGGAGQASGRGVLVAEKDPAPLTSERGSGAVRGHSPPKPRSSSDLLQGSGEKSRRPAACLASFPLSSREGPRGGQWKGLCLDLDHPAAVSPSPAPRHTVPPAGRRSCARIARPPRRRSG